jgi:hypothetical protein
MRKFGAPTISIKEAARGFAWFSVGLCGCLVKPLIYAESTLITARLLFAMDFRIADSKAHERHRQVGFSFTTNSPRQRQVLNLFRRSRIA